MPWTHITAALAAISFWLMVALAATGSLLSALCILNPVSEPKRAPYVFIGQWFIWLATPLLWGAVAASSASEWLKPFDLLLVVVLAFGCRWAARAVCNLKWRGKSPRRLGVRYRAVSPLLAARCISSTYGLHKHHKLD